MSVASATAALTVYANGRPDVDQEKLAAALIADLLTLVDDPAAVLDEARAQYDKVHPETNPARAEHARLEAAQEATTQLAEQWKAVRRSRRSLRGNITRAKHAGDFDRVARLRLKEEELNAQERAARLAFTAAGVRARNLYRQWLDQMDSEPNSA